MTTTTTPFSNESCTNTLWSGTFWLAYGSSGIIAKSTDGVNWTVQTTVTTKITGTIVNVIKQGTRYLAYSATQASASVNDGINWTSYTSTNTETKLNTINGGLSYSTDRFILFGGNTNPINPGVALAYFTTQWHDVDITGNGGISLKLMFTPDILIPKMIFSDNDFFYYELTYNSVFELIKLTDITSNTGDFTNQILKAGGNLYVVDPNGPSVHESTDQGTNWNTDKINTANITSLSGIILSAKGTLFAWGANDSGDFTFYVNNDNEWTVTTGFTPTAKPTQIVWNGTNYIGITPNEIIIGDGKSWTKVTTDLTFTNDTIYNIGIGPENYECFITAFNSTPLLNPVVAVSTRGISTTVTTPYSNGAAFAVYNDSYWLIFDPTTFFIYRVPTGLSITGSTYSSITVIWDQYSLLIDNFFLFISTSNTDFTNYYTIPTGTLTKLITVYPNGSTLLVPGQTYYLTLAGVKNNIQSVKSNQLSVTLPPTPVTFTLSSTTNQITANWTYPTSPTNFKLYWRLNGTTPYTNKIISNSLLTGTTDTLLPNTLYDVAVTALIGANESVKSPLQQSTLSDVSTKVKRFYLVHSQDNNRNVKPKPLDFNYRNGSVATFTLSVNKSTLLTNYTNVKLRLIDIKKNKTMQIKNTVYPLTETSTSYTKTISLFPVTKNNKLGIGQIRLEGTRNNKVYVIGYIKNLIYTIK